ncbi:hypothetical protein [Desulfofundulus thermocisternus]|nr:hypothetical protein [Desulfofundulus thermocisternus]MCS5696530.1 hypothetical protein [Desulfofundulus thermocisternus]
MRNNYRVDRRMLLGDWPALFVLADFLPQHFSTNIFLQYNI